MDKKYFAIPQDLVQKIADYLVSKPYQEVSVFIQGLQQAKPVILQEVSPASPLPTEIPQEAKK